MTKQLAVFGAMILAGLVGAQPASAKGKSGKLQGFDSLTKPGKTAPVKAKLERVMRVLSSVGINPDVEGETLTFYLMEQPVTDARYTVALETPKYLGKGDTDGSGIAKIDFAPPRTGLFKIEARVKQGSDYIALPAPLTVASYEAKAPILVVDLDGTVTNVGSMKVAVAKDEDIKVRSGAAEALNELFHKREKRVVYITARDSTFVNRTRSWMAKTELPPGPVFFWDFWAKSWSEETFKTKLIKSLAEGFEGMVTGIGDVDGDAKAFLANGMTPHILQEEKSEGLSKFAVHVPSWSRMLRSVERQGEIEQLLGRFASRDRIEQAEAWASLSRIEDGLLPCVARFRSDTNLDRAAAARLIMGRTAARQAFLSGLDMSTPSATLNSLAAAWRQGDSWVISRLYRKPEVAIGDCDPPIAPVGGVEVLKLDEPDASTAVYQLRVHPSDSKRRPVETSVKMVQLEDKSWRLETPDF